MSLIEQLHAEHKARLERMKPRVKTVPIEERSASSIDREVLDKLQDQINNLTEMLSEQANTIAVLAKQLAEVNPYFSEILDAVCEFYGVTRVALASSRRTQNLNRPRQIAFYLGRKLTGLSLPQMGARTGGRDHTTVLHGANRVALDLQKDEILRDDLDVLEAKIAEKVLARQPARRGQS